MLNACFSSLHAFRLCIPKAEEQFVRTVTPFLVACHTNELHSNLCCSKQIHLRIWQG